MEVSGDYDGHENATSEGIRPTYPSPPVNPNLTAHDDVQSLEIGNLQTATRDWNGRHAEASLTARNADMEIPSTCSGLTRKSIEGANQLARDMAAGLSTDEIMTRARIRLPWHMEFPSDRAQWVTSQDPRLLQKVREACQVAKTLASSRWQAFWIAVETLRVDRIAITELFYAFSPSDEYLDMDRLQALQTSREAAFETMARWASVAMELWNDLSLTTSMDPDSRLSSLSGRDVSDEILNVCYQAEQTLRFVDDGEEPQMPQVTDSSDDRGAPTTTQAVVDPALQGPVSAPDAQFGGDVWEDLPDVEVHQAPSSRFVVQDSEARRARMTWGKLDIKTKGTKRTYPFETEVSMNLDTNGMPSSEPGRTAGRTLLVEVDEIVNYIYHDCPSYWGNPCKTEIYGRYPRQFTERGDVSADSTLRGYTPEEMGMHQVMWRYLNNSTKTNSKVAQAVEHSKANGLPQSYRPRNVNQTRTGGDNLVVHQVAKRGTFSKNTEQHVGDPRNPTDVFGSNGVTRAMGTLYAISQEDITAEDYNLKRKGTKFATLHAASVQILRRQLEVEKWIEELRVSQAQRDGWYKDQARKALQQAQEAADRDDKWRDLCEQAGLAIPADLQLPLVVNKDIPRYKAPMPDGRTKAARKQFKGLSHLKRPQATLPLASVAERRKQQAKDYEARRVRPAVADDAPLSRKPRRAKTKAKDLQARNPLPDPDEDNTI